MTEENEKDNESAQNNFPLGSAYASKRTVIYSKLKEGRLALAKEFLESGVGAIEFAKQKKIGYSTLKKYLSEYYKENNITPPNARKPYRERHKNTKNNSNKNLFKELQVSSVENKNDISSIKKADHIEIIVNENIKLKMPSNTDINYLIKIIKGISE